MENAKITMIMEYMKQCTVAEVIALVKTIEKEFQVSAKPQVIVMPKKSQQKTEFDLELTDFGKNKVKVIKLIREMTELGLKEAKALVDQAPVIIRKEVSREEAEAMKKVFEEIGAMITLK